MKAFSLILLAMVACDSGFESDERLVAKLQSEIRAGKQTLDMDAIADFEWEQMVILTPFTNPKTAGQPMGVDLSPAEGSGIRSRDDINVLVFLLGGEVVKIASMPRHPGDFSKNAIELIPRSRAVFDVIVTPEETQGGERWVELKRRT